MPREARSAQEIQAEVSRLIGGSGSAGRENPGVTVPLPERLPEAAAGECNWDMTWFGYAIPNPEAVEAAVNEVRARWNLR